MFVRVRPLRLFFRGNRRLSQLPKSPFTASPCSTTPGSPARLTFNGAWARPPPRSNTKAPTNVACFRGSITRLHSLLPTLEGGLSAYQPRVASGDWSGPSGRDSNPQGLDRDFPLFPCFLPFLLIPISLGFGWRHERPGEPFGDISPRTPESNTQPAFALLRANRGRDSPKATPPSEPYVQISRIRLSSHGFTRSVLADVCRTRDSPFGLFDQTEAGRRLH